MELKELAEKFEALKTEMNSALEGFKTRIDEIATKVANATPAAPAAGAQGEGQGTAAGAGTAALSCSSIFVCFSSERKCR